MALARVSVTGITSGVGMRLAEVALSRGLAVRGLVRDPSRADAKRLAALGVELVRGDLEDEASLAELAQGTDACLHLAAQVGDVGATSQFVRINVGGTRRAVVAAARVGVRRFVQLSSTAVYGRPDEGQVEETWPTKHSGVAYDDTKVDAERTAFATGAELGVEVAAIRPPIIYGPYDKNFMPRAVKSLRAKQFLLIDGGQAPLNVVWVDHVVDVCLLAAEHPAAAGQAFNVMDEVSRSPPSVREVAELIADEVGAPRPRLSLPYGVAMALGRIAEFAQRVTAPEKAPVLSPFVVKILTRKVVYDSAKAVRLLGWTPRVTAVQGLREEARAFALRERQSA